MTTLTTAAFERAYGRKPSDLTNYQGCWALQRCTDADALTLVGSPVLVNGTLEQAAASAQWRFEDGWVAVLP